MTPIRGMLFGGKLEERNCHHSAPHQTSNHPRLVQRKSRMVRYSKASLALPPSSPSKPAASILYVILNNNTDAPSNNNDPWHNISHQALLGIEHQLEGSQNSWAVYPNTVFFLTFCETSFEFAELTPVNQSRPI